MKLIVTGALRFDIEGKLGTVIFDPYVGVREIVVIFDDPASITDSPLKGRGWLTFFFSSESDGPFAL